MPETRLTYLLYRHFNDVASPSETEELMALLDKPEHEETVWAVMEESWGRIDQRTAVFTGEQSQTILARILPVRRQFTAQRRVLRWAAAAAIFVLLVTGYWWMSRQQADHTPAVASAPHPAHDALPGTRGAVLTLADGSMIRLDSAGNGMLGMQGGTRLTRLTGGKLIYQQGGASGVLFNTLTTPRGRQFQLELPDGSRVWLNAESSIRYPTAFTGNERRVQVTGEAYFEVTQHAAMPFRVESGGQTIHVLGTRFNVNAYRDERDTRTTLLEGAVRVEEAAQSLVLKPGEQAQSDGRVMKVVNADPNAVIAWKNGLFTFRHAGIRTIVRQLARWYDVDVEYQEAVDEGQSFSGEIGRDLPLSDVLNGLRMTRVHYRIEDKKLIILP